MLAAKRFTLQYNDAYKKVAEQAYHALAGPHVGDVVRMKDGRTLRFTHKWEDGIQTTVKGKHSGSWYLFDNGHASFSGSLDSQVKFNKLKSTGKYTSEEFWFFNQGDIKAHNAHYFDMLVEIWEQL